PVTRVNQHNVQLVWFQVGIVGENATGEIVEGAGKFYARESSSRNHKRQQPLSQRRVCFAISALKHLNHMIADAYSVQQVLEIECQLFHVGHSQVVGN